MQDAKACCLRSSSPRRPASRAASSSLCKLRNNSQDVIESIKARLPLVISGPLALDANCSVSKVNTWTTDLPITDLSMTHSA